jgi:hypothetical protein
MQRGELWIADRNGAILKIRICFELRASDFEFDVNDPGWNLPATTK